MHISVPVFQVFHTISIWLTVTLAVWRYIAIAYPQHNSTWCSMTRTHSTIMAAFCCAVVLNIPNYLNFSISQLKHQGETLHMVGFSRLALAHGGFLKSINFWVYAVVLKLLPCAALTGLSLALIEELLRAARRHSRLIIKRQFSSVRLLMLLDIAFVTASLLLYLLHLL